MQAEFFVGTYARADQESILRLKANFAEKSFTKTLSYSGVMNPSWLLLHPDRKHLYSVQELTPEGLVSSYTILEDTLNLDNTLASCGADPCHLSFNDTGSLLFAANYTSGSLSIFRLDSDGSLRVQCAHIQYDGKGIDPVRQEGPHIHFSMQHEGLLYINDLGNDSVYRCSVDAESGTLSPVDTIQIPGGSGPRHLVFHPGNPSLMYLLCELNSTVYVCHATGSGWSLLQSISALPEGYHGENISAAVRISPDGRTLYASNRGHDSIAVFSVDQDGMLTLRQNCLSGGSMPRDFNLFGNYLVCANQESSLITVLEADPATGLLSDTGMSYETEGKPVNIVSA